MAEADGLAAAVEFGPQQVMMLDAELLRVLTAGDKVSMEAMLSREEHGGADNGRQQANGQVAIDVRSAAPDCFLLGVASKGNTALHLVASRGHVELATLICQRAPSLAVTRNKCLDTPLHCAAKAGHRDVAAVLLSTMQAGGAGTESALALRARNQTGATALYEAVRHGRAGVVDLLMTEAPELSSVATEDGFSPLYLAAMIGSSEQVRALLRASPNGIPSPASFSGPEGRTALHVAATVSKEIAQAILCWEPTGPTLLTRVDSSGRTPLHFAVLYRRLDIVELFLEDHYASLGLLSICDENGASPLHIAAMVGETGIVDALVKRCPDYYELVDDKGRNLLHFAVQHGQERVVVHICQNKTFAMLLNATDSEGNTSLHLAVKYAYPRILTLLLATKDVDTGITNRAGLTAADLAYHARPIGLRRYFLNPQAVLDDCLRWSRSPFTLEGVHGLHVDKKLAGEEASNKDEKVNEARGITSVLIATVAFAAAFTVPGGYVADDNVRAGTAILARRFAFRAFAVSDTIAFVCSMVATCFLTYGAARKIPHNQRHRYNKMTSGFVQVGAQFLIAAFAFGFHLVLGVANRWLIILVYIVCLASVLTCFPGMWVPLKFGVGKAVWCRAGWRGLVNVHKRPSSLQQLLHLLYESPLFKALRKPLGALFVSAMFVVAIVLTIALPNY